MKSGKLERMFDKIKLHCGKDKVMYDFLVDLILRESRENSGWNWKDEYSGKVTDSAKAWEEYNAFGED